MISTPVMDIQHEFGDPERVSARLDFHRRVIAEEEAAREMCERMLVGPSQWWGNAMRQAEGSRTAGMVTVLIDRSEKIFPRSPLDALAICEIAVETAKLIPLEAYPYEHVAKFRGQAYLWLAYLLSFLGRLHQAVEVADRSAFYLKQIPVPPPELARLDLVRSNIARNQERYAEAIEHARSAGRKFLQFGDREGWLKSIDSEAGALFSSHDHRAALAAWQSMQKYSSEMSEQFRAAWLHNIGLCADDAGEFEEAARHYALAAEAFERLGAPVYRMKCRWATGRCLLSAGRPNDAIPLLTSARDEFEAFGMETDAALVALLLVESLLLAGRPNEVPAICRSLIDRFTRAGITGSAMTALAYLRESVAMGHGTPVLVRHVHEFMRDLNRGYEQPFVPFHEPRWDA